MFASVYVLILIISTAQIKYLLLCYCYLTSAYDKITMYMMFPTVLDQWNNVVYEIFEEFRIPNIQTKLETNVYMPRFSRPRQQIPQLFPFCAGTRETTEDDAKAAPMHSSNNFTNKQ